ncbi:hypothetical protein GCM10008927_09230 [Amylibacter ulvae]|uniref:DUF952 domain-containing protein n=1 Tax=Paramylibacter ulvae TaxID=1651968 RepID=A0ABQ3CZN3_9RHOB|nr:DUF952 domain-containing protein [Amylibacter ulvae]GHA46175.1 hypothetical protein GCM10008927_09230 [Amylibacter ulvae]
MLIYKILRTPEWADLQSNGRSNGAPIDISDGYIHFSTAPQASETAAKHFAGEEELLLLAYDSDQLGEKLKWEKSRGDQLFPHLYAPLTLADAIWVKPLRLSDNGHVFPEEMQ